MNQESYITVIERESLQKIEVLFQEEVQLDINVPLFYIKSGEEEVKYYVDKVCKPELNEFVESNRQNTIKQVEDYTNNVAIRMLSAFVEENKEIIANYTTEAKNSAQISAKNVSDALSYAEISAEQATIAQNNNQTIENKINQESLKNKKTNCITEIPQDIKLELNNGTLTLKAGSKVYVPNGFEADGVTPKFDYVIIESDLSTNTGWAPSGQNFLFYDSVNKTFSMYAHNYGNCSIWSGDSPTIDKQYGIWFNTTNNIIRNTNNTGSSWAGKFSLPLTIYTCDSNKKPASIEQIFNGFGYIGSTVFALPGVKGLIPDGRNADGSLKNIELINPAVRTLTISGTYKHKLTLALTGIGAYSYAYDDVKNAIYRTDTGVYYNADRLIVGDISYTNGVVTSFQPKLPFRAVDYSDFKKLDDETIKYSDKAEVVGWGMPDYSAGIALSNKTSFTAPSSGIIIASGFSGTGSKSYFDINGQSVAALAYNTNNYSHDVSSFVVDKGDVFVVSYSGDISNATFYPLKGVN